MLPPPPHKATSDLYHLYVVLQTPVLPPQSSEAALASLKPVPFTNKEYCPPGGSTEWAPPPILTEIMASLSPKDSALPSPAALPP